MDEFRTFMAGRQAPFRLKGLRAIFVTPEDEVDEDDKVRMVFSIPLVLSFDNSTEQEVPMALR